MSDKSAKLLVFMQQLKANPPDGLTFVDGPEQKSPCDSLEQILEQTGHYGDNIYLPPIQQARPEMDSKIQDI
jgi:hypothetical protein